MSLECLWLPWITLFLLMVLTCSAADISSCDVASILDSNDNTITWYPPGYQGCNLYVRATQTAGTNSEIAVQFAVIPNPTRCMTDLSNWQCSTLGGCSQLLYSFQTNNVVMQWSLTDEQKTIPDYGRFMYCGSPGAKIVFTLVSTDPSTVIRIVLPVVSILIFVAIVVGVALYYKNRRNQSRLCYICCWLGAGRAHPSEQETRTDSRVSPRHGDQDSDYAHRHSYSHVIDAPPPNYEDIHKYPLSPDYQIHLRDGEQTDGLRQTAGNSNQEAGNSNPEADNRPSTPPPPDYEVAVATMSVGRLPPLPSPIILTLSRSPMRPQRSPNACAGCQNLAYQPDDDNPTMDETRTATPVCHNCSTIISGAPQIIHQTATNPANCSATSPQPVTCGVRSISFCALHQPQPHVGLNRAASFCGGQTGEE